MIQKTVFFVVYEKNKEKKEKKKLSQKTQFFCVKIYFFQSRIDQTNHQHRHALNSTYVFVWNAFLGLKMQISVSQSHEKNHLEKNQQVTYQTK